jgi:hypothetical protein
MFHSTLSFSGRRRPRWLLALALPTMWLAGGCGATFFVAGSVNNGHLLVAVSVNPASADPTQFLGNQVQFIATGTFNTAPTTVNPLPDVTWTVDQPAFSTIPSLGRASITQDGIAQCTPGFIGVVTVFATASANPTIPVSVSNQKVGTAQLVCH